MNTPTETTNGTIESRLRAIATELHALFPQRHIDFSLSHYLEVPSVDISIFGFKSYAEATEFFRSLGIGTRTKSVYNDHEARTVLKGKMASDIHFTAYCSGLPPSCRLEKKIVQVPKIETREVGEMIEIERVEVVCGQEPALQEAGTP